MGESNLWGNCKKNSNKCNRQLRFRTRASNSTSAADRPPGETGNCKHKNPPRSFEVRSFSQLRSKILFTKISELWMKEYFSNYFDCRLVGLMLLCLCFVSTAIPMPYCLPCRKNWTGLQRLAPPRNFPGSCFAVCRVPTKPVKNQEGRWWGEVMLPDPDMFRSQHVGTQCI